MMKLAQVVTQILAVKQQRTCPAMTIFLRKFENGREIQKLKEFGNEEKKEKNNASSFDLSPVLID